MHKTTEAKLVSSKALPHEADTTKTFLVCVSYIDAQPEDYGTYEKTYVVEAATEFDAEIKAMKECRNEFTFNEPIDAQAWEAA